MNAQRLRLSGAILIIIAILLLGGALFALVDAQEPFTVYADGDVKQLMGSYTTVGEVVSAAVPDISPLDLVIPARETAPDPAVAISVQRAKPVVVETDAERMTYFTHQTTLGGFLHEIRFDLNASDQILADGIPVRIFDLEAADLPERLVVQSEINVTIADGGQRRSVTVSGQTVGDALSQAGMTIYATDQVQPPVDSWLFPNMEIRITRSSPVTILADGRTIETRSPHNTVLPILASAGIGLIGADYTIPAGDAVVAAGGTIEVIRVAEDFAFEDSSIPFESQLVPSDQFEIDTRGLVQSGTLGILRQRFKVRYENGVEVGREFDGEWVAQEPIPELIGYGTNIVVRTMDTPEGPLSYYRKVKMRVTSYMAQTSGKPADHPAYGITASGEIAGYGVVAVDPKVVPFRSDVYVPGYGSAFVGDTGGGVKGRWIDLGYEDDWDTFVHWSGYIDVYFLTPVPDYDRINFLIPTELP